MFTRCSTLDAKEGGGGGRGRGGGGGGRGGGSTIDTPSHLQQVASTSILIVINYHSAEGEGWPRQKYFQRLVIIFRAGDGVGAIKGDADGIRLSPRN